MKKLMLFIKNNLLGFILGIIVTSSISAFAINYLAQDINYNNNTSYLDATNLQDAIDEIYNRYTIAINNNGNQFCKKMEPLRIGTEVLCDPGDGEHRIFHVLKITNQEVTLIMDRNIVDKMFDFETAKAFLTTGDGKDIPTSWKNVSDVSLPSAQDIANAVGNTDWNVNTAGEPEWFYFDKKNGVFGTTQVANQDNLSQFGWLYGYTRECTNFGCPLNTSIHSSCAQGYWTNDIVYNDSTRAWRVFKNGNIGSRPFSEENIGIRLTITVPRDSLYDIN